MQPAVSAGQPCTARLTWRSNSKAAAQRIVSISRAPPSRPAGAAPRDCAPAAPRGAPSPSPPGGAGDCSHAAGGGVAAGRFCGSCDAGGLADACCCCFCLCCNCGKGCGGGCHDAGNPCVGGSAKPAGGGGGGGGGAGVGSAAVGKLGVGIGVTTNVGGSPAPATCCPAAGSCGGASTRHSRHMPPEEVPKDRYAARPLALNNVLARLQTTG